MASALGIGVCIFSILRTKLKNKKENKKNKVKKSIKILLIVSIVLLLLCTISKFLYSNDLSEWWSEHTGLLSLLISFI